MKAKKDSICSWCGRGDGAGARRAGRVPQRASTISSPARRGGEAGWNRIVSADERAHRAHFDVEAFAASTLEWPGRRSRFAGHSPWRTSLTIAA